MSKLEEINNLAIELTDVALEPYEHYEKAKKIYELSLPIELNENQQIVLEWLKNASCSEGSLLIAVSSIVNLTKYDNPREQYEKAKRIYELSKPIGYYNKAHGFLHDECDKDCYCQGGCNMEAVYTSSQVLQAFSEWGGRS